jgi:anthranilate phosphoribosyltransferase
MANALLRVGCDRAWLVHGAGGLDEVSPAGPTRVWAVEGESVREFEIRPADFGLPEGKLDSIRGGVPADNARVLKAVLGGQEGPAADAVIMNAAAALVVAGKAQDLADGASQARAAVADGRAAGVLEELVQYMAS